MKLIKKILKFLAFVESKRMAGMMWSGWGKV